MSFPINHRTHIRAVFHSVCLRRVEKGMKSPTQRYFEAGIFVDEPQWEESIFYIESIVSMIAFI